MLENVLQLVVVLIVFVLVLFAAFYSTKWIAKNGGIQSRVRNITVIQTYKIAPTKYSQIIQMGDKYYSIGVTKDSITFLTPLEEEQLDLKNESASGAAEIKFSDVFKNMTGNYINKKNKKK